MIHPSGLNKRDLVKIAARTDDAVSLYRSIIDAAPDPGWVEMFYLPQRTAKGVAWTCLIDAAHMLIESRYALTEATAYQVSYERTAPRSKVKKMRMVSIGQYYMDDAVLRLYSVAENVADCLKYFYTGSLQYDRRSRGSQLDKLSKLVRTGKLSGSLPTELLATRNAVETRWVMNYRDRWVHRQPMRMEGTGLRYARSERALRTRASDGRVTTTIPLGGTGDKGQTTIAEGMRAVTAFYQSLRQLLLHCYEMMEADIPTERSGMRRRTRADDQKTVS